MANATIKYSQPIDTVVGDPITVATKLAAWKLQEKALLEILGEYHNKQSIKPSTTAGQIIDWTVDVTIPEEESETPPKMSPEVVNTAVSASSAIGGSGDASDYLKTSLPKAVKDLLKFIISSWKGGFDMKAHGDAMKKWDNVQKLLSELSSMVNTAIPDGVPACSTGLQIYQQLSMIIKNTYLKMPQTLTTAEVKAVVEQMNEVNSLNETFSSQISAIVICVWMIIAPGVKLPTAYANSTIIIQAMTKIYNDWLNGGSDVNNLKEVEQLLDTVQA